MRYIRLVVVLIRAAFQRESAFRINFFMNLLSVVLSLMGGIGGIMILYTNKESLNGWTMPETLAVLGVYMLVQAAVGLVLSPSLNTLGGMGGELEAGTFDYTMLRPISKQFYVSLREWSLWQTLHIGVSIGVIAFAVHHMGVPLPVASVFWFLLSIGIAVGIYYAILLAVNSLAFWYRGTYVSWIVGDIMQAGRYPIGIYPDRLRFFLTWVFPLGFIVSIPAEVLSQKAQPVMVLAGLGLMAVLFALATLFFRLSLRRYTSASS